MFRSINDILYRNYNFKVTLTLMGESKDGSDNSKFKRSELIKVYKSKNPNIGDSIYLDTFSRSIIGFCTILPGTSENFQKGESFYISQKSFYELSIALNICTDWLRSSNYKYLFDTDQNGNVKGLGSPPPYHPSIHKNQSEYIRFYPAVVKDLNGVKYEGIAIRSQKSALVQMTCADFLIMANNIKNYLVNSYGNNINLINMSLNIIGNRRL